MKSWKEGGVKIKSKGRQCELSTVHGDERCWRREDRNEATVRLSGVSEAGQGGVTSLGDGRRDETGGAEQSRDRETQRGRELVTKGLEAGIL